MGAIWSVLALLHAILVALSISMNSSFFLSVFSIVECHLTFTPYVKSMLLSEIISKASRQFGVIPPQGRATALSSQERDYVDLLFLSVASFVGFALPPVKFHNIRLVLLLLLLLVLSLHFFPRHDILDQRI